MRSIRDALNVAGRPRVLVAILIFIQVVVFLFLFFNCAIPLFAAAAAVTLALVAPLPCKLRLAGSLTRHAECSARLRRERQQRRGKQAAPRRCNARSVP